MKITVQCPNCYQQVPAENSFCTFCGYNLKGAEADHGPGGSPEPGPGGAPDLGPGPEPIVDGPRYCPLGHDVPDPSLGFCMVCGSPLVNEPAGGGHGGEKPSEEESYTPPTPPARPRTCSCGYVCDDPDLEFCPACGLPFSGGDGGKEIPPKPGWVCPCGQENDGDSVVCTACGKPKGWTPPVEPPKKTEVIPEGMYVPGVDDLKQKSKYGN